MNTSKSKWIRSGLILLMIAVVTMAGLQANTRPAVAQASHNVGMVCNTGPNFSLTTQTGYITLSDLNTMFMWGYSLAGQSFQYPGPVLCVNQGDTVTITLQNNLPTATSIMFPGQENVMANGGPAQPQFNGSALTSLTNVAPASGSMTYSFVASHPGTFIYESGTDTKMQVGMGLFGILIVRPTMGANFAYNRADTQFTPQEEFIAILSEIDPYLHQAVENGLPFNMNTYHPRYWLLNGRGFPDTIADNFANWLPSQPYGALALIQPYDPSIHPNPAIEHFVNVGTEEYPFHPHGQNGLVVGRDGYPLEGAAGQDLSMEKFAINIGPGQTWDVLFKWYDAENYSEANPVPVTIPEVANQTMGMFYSGSPYLGQMGSLPPGQSTLNQCGEYYIISHNHALFQLDAWGQTMSGPITYLRIDPPGGCP
jgi:FtsP/CotA-like multicopper oxidase with cupredoxin domain